MLGRRGNRTGHRIATLCAAALALALSVAPSAGAAFGDARILAPFPSDPGFPEGVAVERDRVYAAGAATFGTTGAGPSTVVVYDRATGATIARHDTAGEDLLAEHANSSIALDGQGRLYVLNTQLGTYRLTPAGVQEGYAAPLPDLAPCAPVVVPPPCSPTPADQPPLPNDIAFARDGSAYVSDSCRRPSGASRRAAALRRSGSRTVASHRPTSGSTACDWTRRARALFVTVTADLQGQASVYSLPLVAKPAAAQMTPFHTFAPGDLPDGIAFGKKGDLYVAMASPLGSGVTILRPDGAVKAELRNPIGNLTDPYDGPANIAFDGAGRILLTNHAPVTGLKLRRFSIADTDVEDKGARLF